jgi:rRNA pseudouridine-1189 N-methylase Emg1 (Nep1/Mra1 family)
MSIVANLLRRYAPEALTEKKDSRRPRIVHLALLRQTERMLQQKSCALSGWNDC